ARPGPQTSAGRQGNGETRPAAQAGGNGEPAPANPHHDLRGRKVLIIDDDVRNVFAITSVLELYGLTVSHAPDGRKGLDALLASNEIDLVLMDVMMPELDGYATTAAIRKIPRFAQLPVIAVTARAMPEDRAKSLVAGTSAHVTKPVDTEELLTCMEHCLRQQPAGRAAGRNGKS
ncbi:MAG: response regulator, partial [Actinobacteria bacterium]|nr:response regulator [Actinomycetota bacterium]